MTDTDDLKDDLDAFKRASEAEAEQRRDALEMLKFVKLGDQWPHAVRAERELKGRPCLTINRLPAFGKQVTNDARQNRPMIKCHPVGEKADRETADILNGLIRNIEYTSNADVAYDTALDFAVNSGIGYATVNIDYADDDTFDKDIRIDRVDNPFAIYGDPDSKAADSSDWNKAFIIQKMTKDAFERKWPDAQSSGFDKADANSGWFEEEKIQVAESWTRILIPSTLLKLSDGSIMAEEQYLKLKDVMDVMGITVEGDRETQSYQVSQRIITGLEILQRNSWAGKYIPIVPCYGDEVNVDGKRSWQSLFHFAKDSQKNYNYHRSAITEAGALAPKTPFIGPVKAFITEIDKWTTANTEAHAFIGYDGAVPPQRQGFAGPPAGFMAEALASSDDMKAIIGLYDASLGQRSNETSGRAILARQREGDVSTFNFIDNQSRMIRHLGRILVDLIPKVYNVARIVRVIKEDGTNYSVPVNQPVQVIQKPQIPGQSNVPEYRPVDPNNPPSAGPMPMPMPQGPGPQPIPMQGGAMPPQQPGMPQMGQPPVGPPGMPQQPQISGDQRSELSGLIKTFDLAAGKYDVTCESGPSFNTRREEAANQMMQFVQAFPQSAPIIGDLIAKSLDWPGADEIAKRLQGMLPPAAQGQNPQLMQAEDAIHQLKAQLQQCGQQLQEKQSDFQIRQGELQIKAQEAQAKLQEVQTHQFDSQTKRMQIMEASKQQPVVEENNHFEEWKFQMQDSFDRWQTEYKEQQANMRKQMEIEGAERLELLKLNISSIVNQESIEPEQELNTNMDGLQTKQEPQEAKPDPLAQLAEMHSALMQNLQRPKTIIRDANGRATGIQ